MKIVMAALATTMLMTGCMTASELQPIPGSITYNGQPRTKLTKAPIGSIVPHRFTGDMGETVYETYVIQPDRSLKLVQRRRDNLFFPDP